MRLPFAQLVSLPRLLQTIRFPSNYNTWWRLLNFIIIIVWLNPRPPLTFSGGSYVIRRRARNDSMYDKVTLIDLLMPPWTLDKTNK
jgi:hypothetical protein